MAQANVAALQDAAAALPGTTQGAWFRGIGAFGSVNGNGAAPGFDINGGGFLAGYDHLVADNAYLGIAGGYQHTDVDEHSPSSGRIDTGRVSLYGGAWYGGSVLTGTAGYAHDSISTTRGIAAVGTAQQKHGGDEASVAGQWAVPLPVTGLGGGMASLTPRAGLQFLHLSEGSFAENGAGGFNLSSGARDTDSLQPYIGIAAAQEFVTDGGMRITPELRLGYARETLSNSRALSVITVGGAIFVVDGVRPSRDILTAGLPGGLGMAASANIHPYANDDPILRTGNTSDQIVSAGARIKF
jgi:outer membrane autotransporter protein